MLAPAPRGPIHALDALEQVEAQLGALLETITPEEWDTPTIVPGWRVRHVAGHLLDTALRKLSVLRDGFAVEGPASGGAGDVRDFVHRINAEGVKVYGRLSVETVRLLMAQVSPAMCDWHRQLDPDAPAGFPVSWAGETESPNWFDTARELTERWHHQAQIRLALQRPPLFSRALYHPVLDTFMRVLPFAYREVRAIVDTLVTVRVDGEAGDDWQLYRTRDRWLLTSGVAAHPAATITLPEALAWRIFTKGMAPGEAVPLVTIEGDQALASHVLGAVAIVA